ncbi:MAG: hypothetical protein V1867_08285 [Candidatus Falkowbacteria bacterium]
MEKKPITTDQLGEIIEQSKKKNGQRIHRDNLQAFLRNPRLVDTKPYRSGAYSIAVNYDKNIEEMIDDGRYKRVYRSSINFSSDNLKHHQKKGKGITSVEIICPNEVISSDDFLGRLKKDGLRPASIQEFLSFLNTHPEIPTGLSVVCLDSFKNLGDHLVFCVRSSHSERTLTATFYDTKWDKDTNFLVVRESVQAPQPLKTFLLFEEIHDPTVPGPDSRKILATIQATDEKAAAAHLGGEYIRFLGPLDNGPSILLPRKLFKPCGKYRTRDMMEFRQNGLNIRIDARCAEHYIRIEEVPNIIAS